MPWTWADHLLRGTHTARPGASTVPDGSLYSCTDHDKVYQSDGAAWSDYVTSLVASSPQELGYAEITATVSTSSLTLVDAPGLTVTVTIGSRPVMVEFWAGTLRSSGSDTRALAVLYDVTAGAQLAEGITSGVNQSGDHVDVRRRHAPAAGSRTYKVQYRGVSTGTTDIIASAVSPAFIRVMEF